MAQAIRAQAAEARAARRPLIAPSFRRAGASGTGSGAGPSPAAASRARILARLAPLLVALLAFGLALWRLDFQALWWDEGLSIWLALQKPAEVLADRARDVHPPGYFLLLGGWLRLVGATDVTARFLSAACAAAGAAALYALGARLARPTVGLLAALLLALSPYHLHHAQQARMYALVPFLVALSSYLLLRAIAAEERRAALPWALGYALATAALPQVHYYTVFLPLAQGLWILSLRRREALARWLAAAIGAALLALPWALYAGAALGTNARGKVAMENDLARSLPGFLARYLGVLAAGYESALPAPGLVLAALLLGLLAIGGYLRWRRADASSARLPALWLGLGLLAGFAMNLVFPFEGFPRLLAFAAPALWLLVAYGLAGLARRSAPLASLALLALVVFAGTGWAGRYGRIVEPEEDFRPLAARLAAELGPDDLVVVDFPWQVGYAMAYAPGLLDRVRLAPGEAWAAEEGRMARDLDAWLAEGDLGLHGARLWYPAYQALGGTRGRNIEGYLAESRYLAGEEWIGNSRLLLYGGPKREPSRDAPAEPLGPLEAPEGLEGRLDLAAASPPARGRAGSVLPVELAWDVALPPAREPRLFAQLLAPDGSLAAQRDWRPARDAPDRPWTERGAGREAVGLSLAPGLAPGSYTLIVGLYDAETGARYLTEDGADHLPVGRVTVKER